MINIGEDCDNGTANADDAACTTQCAVAACGDGLLYAGVEACDDGPANANTAACTSSCAVASCGDGFVHAGVEACDAGGIAGSFCDASCSVIAEQYGYTGAVQSVVVPAWATRVRVNAYGAQGGSAYCCDDTIQDDGGLGGYAAGTIDLVAGDTLYVFVGGQGVAQGEGGFNGGGAGGQWGAGGGGASDVRIGGDELANRVLVAGGGGGGNCGCPDHGIGGAGGGLSGDPGLGFQGYPPGDGGTQDGGGLGGSPGAAGVAGVGGGTTTDPYHIGGGGGGFYGGGGGYAAGGGGGSSYIALAADAETIAGAWFGSGHVSIVPMP